MNDNSLMERVLACAIEIWFKDPRGSSSIEVSQKVNANHDEVRDAMLALEADGKGRVKRNVTLHAVSISIGVDGNNVITNEISADIFFPSKEQLKAAYYQSKLPEAEPSEYSRRLHLGAGQANPVFFRDEVLLKYYSNPELYTVEDSLSGGDIKSRNTTSDIQFIHLRYGRVLLKNGLSCVTALYKDLGDLSKTEQSYWSAFELPGADPDFQDEHTLDYIRQTYMGEWVDIHDPISTLTSRLKDLNDSIGDPPLFRRNTNVHLRLPAVYNYKAFSDAGSELYKLVGPDSIDTNRLKALLETDLGVDKSRFVHVASNRSLSPKQLMKLLEAELGLKDVLTKPLKKLSDLRNDADHRVLPADAQPQSYSREFSRLCDEISDGIQILQTSIEARRRGKQREPKNQSH